MQSLMKLNGKWTEGTPYVKEGGTWKEIGAVTAKLDGKWADIKPPGPAVRTWTKDDFENEIYTNTGKIVYVMRPGLRQYFIVGDTLKLEALPYVSTPIPGVSDGNMMINGGVISGKISKNDAVSLQGDSSRIMEFTTPDWGSIPITDGEPPVYEPRTWTIDDFERSGNKLYIKHEWRSYFMVGDTLDLTLMFKGTPEWVSAPVPGIALGNDGTYATITGTITGGTELSDVLHIQILTGGLGLKRSVLICSHTLDPRAKFDRPIPIKPAP